MGCGSSTPAAADRATSRRYLDYAGAGEFSGDGAPLYLPSTGPLTAKEYKERLTTSDGTQTVYLPESRYSIKYAYVSQRGYYPDSPDKPNQDAFCVHTYFGGGAEQHLFGVFDGHGEFGTQAAHFARDRVPSNLLASGHFSANPALAMHNAMVTANIQCHQSDFDDSMSGTTAVCLLVRGRTLLVANVGDSRAVLAERVGGDKILARDLSLDQTPYRRDECERVKACGARVLTLDQIEGLKDPTVDCWTTEEEDDGDPPRLWFPNGQYPGTAFTRSIGDAAAERIGVFAEPEIEGVALTPNDAFMVIASDGVFEFLSSQSVVDMVSKFDDLYEAALSVVAESYRLWLQYETRTDDITMIILQFSGLDGGEGGGPGPGLPMPPPSVAMAPHTRVLSELGLQHAPAARVPSHHSLPPPPPVRLPDIDPTPAPGGDDDDAAGAAPGAPNGGAAQAGGGGAPGSPSGAPGSPGGSVTNLLESSEARAARAASDLGSGLKIGPNVGAELVRGISSVGTVISNEKTQAVVRMLEESVRNNFLFAHLTDGERAAVFAEMERVEVQPGEVVIRQGDRGDHFFVVERGEFDVLVAPPLPAPADAAADASAPGARALRQQASGAIGFTGAAGGGDGGGGQEPPPAGVDEADEWRVIDQGELVHTYRAPLEVGMGPHPSFGELALLYGKPRAATVVAVSDGTLWRIGREAFRSAIRSQQSEPPALVVKALRSMELLAPLTVTQLQRLAEALKIEHYRDGDYICRQGGTWDAFHIVAKGTVVATTLRKTGGAASEAREVLSMGPGQYFGERHLLGASVRPASMIARGDVTVLTMTRAVFESMFGPLQDLLNAHSQWRTWLEGQRELLSRSQLLGANSERVLAAAFDPARLVLKGALWVMAGYQALAEVAEAGGPVGGVPPVALTARVLSVADVEARRLGPAVLRSRAVTRALPPCLFVPHTVMAWSGGGGAYSGEVLATMGVCTLQALLAEGPLDDYSAAYITACCLLGLSHLHSLGFVYRGLSALTILVTEAGVMQLVDFRHPQGALAWRHRPQGSPPLKPTRLRNANATPPPAPPPPPRFARRNEGRAFTLCGPPQYLAPEVLAGTGHTEAVDWWALGVLVYHLLSGEMPFAGPGDDELRVYKRIARASPSFPAILSPEARDLVGGLLQRDPDARLGMAPGGVPRLMSHPWFRAIDWAQLREGRSTMPLLLRDRLFNSAGGDLVSWQPPLRSGQAAPTWVEEF
ncbi:phosphatase 2C and cyclic nucleotide-binding kinase domain-containing protein [Raphidocelis subcapitata]|uniref:protein-serine/threonine phosphatase n=1 Tax=Raphidocelis subcapitata TaxID=307507 RepID=A0A2V0NLA8_9CHLO|nr:phosphatase 2C and cyclic nucleotide-binding kinase domain-containing protein [Raphidocelis subcapitata]|eukprot:GBF88184.1 phosphatase 2C and cyclic nucleotide-binding kinase domain-containing protein [Raphidocelis subcapitata]